MTPDRGCELEDRGFRGGEEVELVGIGKGTIYCARVGLRQGLWCGGCFFD